jgi:hypothetical protein
MMRVKARVATARQGVAVLAFAAFRASWNRSARKQSARRLEAATADLTPDLSLPDLITVRRPKAIVLRSALPSIPVIRAQRGSSPERWLEPLTFEQRVLAPATLRSSDATSHKSDFGKRMGSTRPATGRPPVAALTPLSSARRLVVHQHRSDSALSTAGAGPKSSERSTKDDAELRCRGCQRYLGTWVDFRERVKALITRRETT